MKRLLPSALALTTLAATPALAADAPPGGWFVQTRFLGSLSSAPGSFAVLPPGATGDDQTSYQPQEYFGAGAGIGYQFSAWGVPFRAVVDGTLNFRHDTDVEPIPLVTPNYHGNLQTLDLRMSLLADVLDFGWGRFYVGAGLGAARVKTEVVFEQTPVSVSDTTWKISPSFEAGIAFTGLGTRVYPTIGYRFRYVGDVESGTFPDGSKVRYSDFNIHDIMFGLTVPLQAAEPAALAYLDPGAAARSGDGIWTGFHIGAFGGWGTSEDFEADALTGSGGAPYNALTSYGLSADGFNAGAEIGVDWQWRWLVMGLSGEAGILNVEGDATDPTAPGGDTTTSFSSDWYGAVSLRAGLAYDRLLAYGRVGVMYVNAEAETRDSCTVAPCSPTTASASEEDVLFGWLLGAGVEYALGPHWSLGAEYRYYHLNDDLQPEGSSSTPDTVSQNVDIAPIHAGRASIRFRW